MTVGVGDSETVVVGGTEAVTEMMVFVIHNKWVSFVPGRENTRLLRKTLNISKPSKSEFGVTIPPKNLCMTDTNGVVW